MSGRLWRPVVVAMMVALAGSAAASEASATAIHEFSKGLPAGSDLGGIAAGPDGNLWFTDGGATKEIGRITPAGKITMFKSGLTHGDPSDITLGPDGNLWFTETGSPNNAIGRVTPSGKIKEFTLHPGSAPNTIQPGPGGALWFLDNGAPVGIGRITTNGTITEFGTTNGLHPMSQPNDLTVGGDGNLWFTDQGDPRAIGRVEPDGTIKEFIGPLDPLNSFPNELTAGADGNVWFTDDGTPGAIGQVTPGGTIQEFNKGMPMGAQPDSLTLAPDGNVWFADQLSGHKAMGRVTPAGSIKEFKTGLNPMSLQDDITVAADGNLWIEQSMPGGVARITTGGTITQFAKGLNPGAGNEKDQLVPGPDGNLWFTDDGAKPAIGKVSLQIAPKATTGPASKISHTTATVSGSVNPLGTATTVSFHYGTTHAVSSKSKSHTLLAGGDAAKVTAGLSGLPAGKTIYYRVVASNPFGSVDGAIRSFKTPKIPTRSTKAKFDDQRITLTTTSPSACTAKSSRLSVKLSSSKIPHSHNTVLHFKSAAFYVDQHTKATATPRRLPSTVAVRLSGLKSGAHTLRVRVTYTASIVKHGHRLRVKLSKTLRVKFRVC